MKKLIIDVDAGVDDAIAIMMALSTPDVEVLGITCCYGNTSVENVLRNVLRVLKVCDRLDIPVYRGCSKPLVDPENHADNFFGSDGFGDVPDPDAPSLDLVQQKKAKQAIIDLVNANDKEVILISTAPLMNLAAAVQLDPSLPKKLKALYIMGGTIEARGNTTICGEFNFVCDPEAAYIVLDRYTCPTYMATWEFTCRNTLPWSFCDNWLSVHTEKSDFVEKILRISRQKCEEKHKEFNPCDAYAMAAALNDAVIPESEEVAVTVELQGIYTRGMMVLDRNEKLKKEHKVFIMKNVDLEKFKEMLINAVKKSDAVHSKA
ncbi:inosine-uridine preferring nucleoside hydrolase-like [Neolamprologus brichardi]|nr:inosine-uridine preferring nucleoside hydrolase-like [Neolamprologus brichardi]